ncbi:hypothetical protein [Pseudomonas sp. Irchel s3h9]|jgi:hypothetical protein|uniref:hypothetical protein n=1 Tax=Pseudomonas sp. Irchel s3h9 TaxID=2009192 RepID=UPI000BA3DB3D|nr:hypothetical protein [Pseudomonas sp. Irchel s3h9]
MYTSTNLLKLVYPPISNQFAEWLWEVRAVREYVKKSKLYMLAQRREVLFRNYDVVSNKILFDLVCGEYERKNLSICISELIGNYDSPIEIELGPRSIKIYNPQTPQLESLYWATTDKVLFDSWRNRLFINGLDDTSPFTKYNLYYVGISKEGDSFSRLFENGHKNRLRILTNETQYSPTARLSDELYIFLFDIDDYAVKILTEDDSTPPGFLDKKTLAADAEKAFVKILQSKYNIQKYPSYPKGADGLFGSGLTSYSYMIDEDITFLTATSKIRGAHYLVPNDLRSYDFIHVKGEDVKIVSGG